MSKPLHIVLFDSSLATTTFIARLAQGLAAHHQVSFIGFGGTPKNRNSNIRFLDVGTSSNSFRLFVKSLGYAFQLLFKKGQVSLILKTFTRIVTNQKGALKQQNVDSALQLLQPDVLHVQWPSLLPWCETAIATNAIKVVLSQRGYQSNVRPFVTADNLDYLKNNYPRLDGFHSVSQEMIETGNRIFNEELKIDTVVYSGFDFSILPFQQGYLRNEHLKILSIGRPHWIKGYVYALQACKLLKDDGFSFTYTIVGALGNEELQYRIYEYNLTDCVLLTDKISQQEVYDLMHQQDVLLFPSIKEGMPNVIVESMALGLPVIATDCGGVAELLDATTGILIPTRNPTAIAAAITTFAETPLENINSRRLEARKRVEARHSVEEMVLGMEGLYNEVLGVD